MQEDSSNFEELPLARTQLPAEAAGVHYRVYSDAKTYTTIRAVSALEALEQSGMGKAFKIERENITSYNFINPAFWDITPHPEAAEPTAQAAPEPAPADAAPPPAAPAAEALSNNDVDKLLNG